MEFLKRNKLWAVFACVAIILLGYVLLLAPPATFPSGKTLIIDQGTGLSEIAYQLSDAHIVAHPTVLEVILRVMGAGTTVQAGAYRFENPENVLVIAYRLGAGVYNIPPARITFVEGVTVRESGALVAAALPGISASEFITVAKPYEGYLFPDTYIFPPGSDVNSVVATMRANFDTKIATLASDIAASGHSLSDIIIMASLVEKEARTTANRKLVAGVLWNRLARNMPLQVDAVFGYIFGRDTYSPSYADLKVDSPYNTYAHTGLPPGPIDNPGLDSIEAVLHPTQNKYFYYLTDKNGVMHYAITYAEHQTNQRKFLSN